MGTGSTWVTAGATSFAADEMTPAEERAARRRLMAERKKAGLCVAGLGGNQNYRVDKGGVPMAVRIEHLVGLVRAAGLKGVSLEKLARVCRAHSMLASGPGQREEKTPAIDRNLEVLDVVDAAIAQGVPVRVKAAKGEMDVVVWTRTGGAA
jgi:hypothetical protein